MEPLDKRIWNFYKKFMKEYLIKSISLLGIASLITSAILYTQGEKVLSLLTGFLALLLYLVIPSIIKTWKDLFK